MSTELFETQATTEGKARLLLKDLYPPEEIEKILNTLGQAALLVDFVSRVVRIGTTQLYPTIEPTPEVSKPKPAEKKEKKGKKKPVIYLSIADIQAIQPEIALFLQLQIDTLAQTWKPSRPWQQLISQAITQWNGGNPQKFLFQYDFRGKKKEFKPGEKWKSEYKIGTLDDACTFFGVSIPKTMKPKKSIQGKESKIPETSIAKTPIITPENKDTVVGTLSRDIGHILAGVKPEAKPEAKPIPETLIKTTPSKPADKRTVPYRKMNQMSPDEMKTMIDTMSSLIGDAFLHISKKDTNICEKWEGIGEFGSFSWDQGRPGGKPTINIRFDQGQKVLRQNQAKAWARLGTNAFKEQLKKNGWHLVDTSTDMTSRKCYQFTYGNYQVRFFLPFGIDILNEQAKTRTNDRIGAAGGDLPTNFEIQMGVPVVIAMEQILNNYLGSIYQENSRIYQANRSFEIGQRGGNTNLKKNEFTINTRGNVGYDIERNIQGKKITIYQPTAGGRDVEKMNQITSFLKKKTMFEEYLAGSGFQKKDTLWTHDNGTEIEFIQNGASPILRFRIQGWTIEFHTSKREHDYGIERKYV